MHWSLCRCIEWDEFDGIRMHTTKIERAMIRKSICHINSLKYSIPKMFYYTLRNTYNEYCFELCSLDALIFFFLFNHMSCLCLVYTMNRSTNNNKHFTSCLINNTWNDIHFRCHCNSHRVTTIAKSVYFIFYLQMVATVWFVGIWLKSPNLHFHSKIILSSENTCECDVT